MVKNEKAINKDKDYKLFLTNEEDTEKLFSSYKYNIPEESIKIDKTKNGGSIYEVIQ